MEKEFYWDSASHIIKRNRQQVVLLPYELYEGYTCRR